MAYYQNTLGVNSLKSGTPFTKKNHTYVIFICDYDPFGLDLPRYDIEARLKQDLSIMVETGEHNIAFNARAKKWTGISKGLRAFLTYIHNNRVTDEFTQELDNSVKELKKNTERRGTYMTLERELIERAYYARQEGLQEGLQEGELQNAIKNAKRIIELSLQQGLDEDYIINFAHEVTDLSVEELKKIYDETVNVTAG